MNQWTNNRKIGAWHHLQRAAYYRRYGQTQRFRKEYRIAEALIRAELKQEVRGAAGEATATWGAHPGPAS